MRHALDSPLQVYARAGLALWPGVLPETETLRRHVVAARALSDRPDLFLQLCYPRLGQALAACSLLKLYPGTWMEFHLAVPTTGAAPEPDAQDAWRALRERSRQAVVDDLQARWLVSYLREGAPMGPSIQLGVVQRRGWVQPFRAWRIPTDTVGDAAPAAVHALGPQDLPRAGERIARRRHPGYVDALGLGADVQGVERFMQSHPELERRRQAFAWRFGGRTMAIGVAECARQNLHLHGLFDSFRIHVLRPAGGATDALLTAAAHWFRKQGRSHFAYLAEDEAPDRSWHAHDLGAGRLCALPADALVSLRGAPSRS